jgi:hypothetical protein
VQFKKGIGGRTFISVVAHPASDRPAPVQPAEAAE